MKHVAKKREIVLLSDFNEFIETDALKKMLYRSNVHCFQLLCPLDESKNIPFSFLGREDQFSSATTFVMGSSKDEVEFKNPFGKKFKKLRVQDRYLENFIKEML